MEQKLLEICTVSQGTVGSPMSNKWCWGWDWSIQSIHALVFSYEYTTKCFQKLISGWVFVFPRFGCWLTSLYYSAYPNIYVIDWHWTPCAGPGQSLEELNYDTVQDLSLLLDSGGCGRGSGVRRLGYSLGVTPEVLSNLHGFQDLFQYLRTSTYILLPQLAQAAALLPRPDVVARIHRGLVANHTEISRP